MAGGNAFRWDGLAGRAAGAEAFGWTCVTECMVGDAGESVVLVEGLVALSNVGSGSEAAFEVGPLKGTIALSCGFSRLVL